MDLSCYLFLPFLSTLNSIFLCSVSYPYNTSKEYMITKSIQLKPWSKSVSDQLSGSKYDVTSTLIKNVQPMSRTDVLAWDRSLAQLAIRAFLNNRQCDQIGRFLKIVCHKVSFKSIPSFLGDIFGYSQTAIIGKNYYGHFLGNFLKI